MRSLSALLLLSACSDQGISKVNIDPQATITAPASGAVVDEGDTVWLRGSASDSNDDVSTLTAWWLAGARELCPPDAPADDGTTSCEVLLDEDESTVTLEVHDPHGATDTDAVTLVIDPNAAPVVALIPPDEEVYAGELLVLSATATDEEDDPDALTVTWASSLDGPLSVDDTPSADGELSGPVYLSEGEHYLTLTATDSGGRVGEDALVLEVSSANTAPSCAITAPTDGAVVVEGEEVVLTAWAEDAEDPPEALSVRWESDLDGLVDATGPDEAGDISVLATGLSAGEHTISLTVTDSAGLAVVEQVQLVVDGRPSAPVVSISPASPGTDDDLTAVLDLPSTDPEGEALSYTYEWYLDGTLSAASATETLPASATTRGETWTVRVTPSDGTSEGAAGEASATIANTAPGAPTVAISPSAPEEGEDALVCAVETEADDADGDALSYTISWSLDGGAWTGTASTTTRTGDTVAASYTTEGDVWTCSVVASDGEDLGAAGTDSVTVEEDEDLVGTPIDPHAIELSGELEYDYAGFAVAIVPDLDDDGLNEVLVGGRCMNRYDGDPYYEGVAYLVLGSTIEEEGSMSLADADYVFESDESDDHLGSSVAGLDDIDGDGVGDFVIGAMQGSSGARGRAYVFSGAELGRPGTYSPSSADWIVTGVNTRDYAGGTVASAGDMDGDGLTDLALGGWGYDNGSYNEAGAVIVFLASDLGSTSSISASAARWTVLGVDVYHYIGRKIATGDVDGDGADDLVLGNERSAEGCVYVFLADELGDSGSFETTDASYTIDDAADGGSCGMSISTADVDGDGRADVITADYYAGSNGEAYAVAGADLASVTSMDEATYTVAGESGFSLYAAHGVPDREGDGLDDLLILDWAYVGTSGADSAALYVSGASLSTAGNTTDDADWLWYSTTSENFGASSFGMGPNVDIGDLDGDGAADFLIGSGYNSEVDTYAGKVYVTYGP